MEERVAAPTAAPAAAAPHSEPPAAAARDTDPQRAEPGPKRYYRIGEVAKLTGIKPHVLRYWESEFRWMAPHKSRSKQRMYRQRDIEVILLLKRLLHEERFTIAGARKKLRELGIARALETPQLDLGLEIDHAARYRRIREELQAIRALL